MSLRKSNFWLLVFAVALSSCDVAPPGPGQGTNQNGSQNEGGSTADDSDNPGDDTDGGDSPSPAPPDAARMKQIAESGIQAAAATAIVAITARDIQPIFEWGLPEPACPQLGAELAGRDLDLTFDFDDGCNATHAPAISVRGRARGIYYAAYNAFDLFLENVSVNDEELRGMFTGRFDVSGPDRRLVLHLNMQYRDVQTRGTVTAAFTADSIGLTAEELTVTNSAEQSFVLSSLHVDVLLKSSASLQLAGGSTSILPAPEGSSTPIEINWTQTSR